MDSLGITNYIALLLMLAVFGSFYWARKGFFYINSESNNAKLIAITLLIAILLVIQLIVVGLSASQFSIGYCVGILLYFYSLTIFWWAVLANEKFIFSAIFSEDAPQHLVTKGPYYVVRHPFYSAYLAAWLAGPVISQQWYLLFTTVIMFAVFFYAAKKEERKFSDSNLSQEYLAYKKTTGMFIPSLYKYFK